MGRLKKRHWQRLWQWQWHVKRMLLQVLAYANAPIGLLLTITSGTYTQTIGQFGWATKPWGLTSYDISLALYFQCLPHATLRWLMKSHNISAATIQCSGVNIWWEAISQGCFLWCPFKNKKFQNIASDRFLEILFFGDSSCIETKSLALNLKMAINKNTSIAKLLFFCFSQLKK